MEYIAKDIEFNNRAYNGKHLCLCVFSEDPEQLEKIVASYPVTYWVDPKVNHQIIDGRKYPIGETFIPMYTEIDGKNFRVLAFISKNADAVDGEVLKEEDLFWCDPKTLHTYSKTEYFPLKNLLFEQRSSVISAEIKIKRLVYRIL